MDSNEVDPDSSWITRDFIQSLLNDNDNNSKYTVTSLEVKPALACGENYLSKIYRVIADVKQEEEIEATKNLIIKALPKGDIMIQFVKTVQVFSKEYYMYETIFPIFHSMWKEKSPVYTSNAFVCKMYKTSRQDTLVFDDLSVQGYEMADRRQRLDINHCLLVIKNLAKLHASSVGLKMVLPEVKDTLREVWYTEDRREIFESYLKPTIISLSNVVKQWEGMERFGEKLKQLSSSAMDIMIDAVKVKVGSTDVLNHGDCWINNIMFSYNKNGEPSSLKFLDFQLSRICSPVVDLAYFIASSSQENVINSQIDYLLEEYLKALNDNLNLLGKDTNIYTLKELKEGYEKLNKFSLVISCTLLSSVLADPEDALDLSELTENNREQTWDMMARLYNGRRFKDVFSKILLRYEKEGTL